MPAIQINAVTKQYPLTDGGVFTALDNVSFTIAEGEFFGLLGPNGAGKTTLISMLAGLSRPTTGRIAVTGCDVQQEYRKARRNLGVVPQELVFDPFFSIRDALRIQSGYFGIRHNSSWIDELLTGLGLTDKADTNMRALSGGMKRRAMVAQALVHKPPVIVLDEPTAGVDVELRNALWQFVSDLNRKGHTVLLTTHYLEEAEALCGRIAMLKQGRLVTLAETGSLLRQVSSSVLRFKTDTALPEPFATQARVTGRIVQLPLPNDNDLEKQLAGLRQAGVILEDVEVRKADLEDVFLHIMQQGQGQGQASTGTVPADTLTELTEAESTGDSTHAG